MSRLIRCDSGLHQYDSTKHSRCPYCAVPTLSIVSDELIQKDALITDKKPFMANETKKTKLVSNKKPEMNDVRDEVAKKSGEYGEKKTKLNRTSSGYRPVVGWIVIVSGIGKGKSIEIYEGVNTIGRGGSQDIRLSFEHGQEDHEIARNLQAKITYDPRGKTFYLQHGEAKNLTYLNEQPVMELKVLTPYDKIEMGNSALLFVPLCGEQFVWEVDS